MHQAWQRPAQCPDAVTWVAKWCVICGVVANGGPFQTPEHQQKWQIAMQNYAKLLDFSFCGLGPVGGISFAVTHPDVAWGHGVVVAASFHAV